MLSTPTYAGFGGIVNSGTISAGGLGVFVGGYAATFGTFILSTYAGQISNSGTISGGIGLLVGGLPVGLFGAVDIDSVTGGIVNGGTISAAAKGILVGGEALYPASNVTVSAFSGGITNSGTISSTGGTGIEVGGDAAAPFAAVTVSSFKGGITNSGSITAGLFGIMVGGEGLNQSFVTVSSFAGGITNSGFISASAGIFVGAAVANGNGLVANFSGGITNSGTVSGRAQGIIVGAEFSQANNIASLLQFSGGITNTGLISTTGGQGILVGAAGAGGASGVFVLGTFSGGIVNDGTIFSSNSTGGANGILVGALQPVGVQPVGATFQSISGGIVNRGAITVDSLVADGIFVGGVGNTGMALAIANFSGNIVNAGALTVKGDTEGVGVLVGGEISGAGAFVRVDNFDGGVSNAGSILVTGNVIDAGIAVGGFAITGGTLTISTFSGRVTNSGTISAGVGILVGGTAEGGTLGIGTFAGGVTNSGTISATKQGVLIGGLAEGAGTTLTVSTFAGGIVNTGTIAAGVAGIYVGGAGLSGGSLAISSFSGGITNTGVISAGTYGIFVGAPNTSTAATIAAFSGNISNSGRIVAGTGIFIGAHLGFAADSAIVNSGTIIGTGGIAINASIATSPVTIDQTAGLIQGNILLSANADVVNISGGMIAGNIVGQGSSDTINFALGSGTFTYGAAYGFSAINQLNVFSGTVILDGTNAATNVAVNGGTLEIGDASNPGALLQVANLAVNSGGTLAGNGTIDQPTTTVTIDAGGTLAPGTPGGLGTLTIDGTLIFNAESYYAVQIAPGAGNNSNTVISGTANLSGNGTVLVTPQLGRYSGATYQILTTTGGLSGAFAGVTVNGDFSGTAKLDYLTNPGDVDLDVTGVSLLATPPGANTNQQNVTTGINNAIFQGPANTPLPPQFQSLGNLAGAPLLNALTALSGEAATGAEQSAFQLTTAFLNLMLDPFVNGRGNLGGSPGSGNSAIGFAPDEQASLPPDVALAYASILGKAPSHPSPASGAGSGWGLDQRWSAWGAAFGGSNTTSGDPTVGSHDTVTGTYGFAAGMDYHVSPSTTVGFALAGAGTNWGLSNGLGSGYSDALQVGTYGISWFGPAYLAGALSLTNHWFTTNRSALGDQLTANFVGQSYGARFEGGYRFTLSFPSPASGGGKGWGLGVTPYGALQAQDFQTSSYSESDTTGGGFGLSYNAMNATDVRTELGARFDDPTLIYGKPLILFGRLAWAHDFVSNPALSAAFESLPGSTFTVNGAPIPKDSGLTTAGVQFFLASNWSIIGKIDGEFAPGSRTYGGSGTLRYSW
jgi:hypothetical protein